MIAYILVIQKRSWWQGNFLRVTDFLTMTEIQKLVKKFKITHCIYRGGKIPLYSLWASG